MLRYYSSEEFIEIDLVDKPNLRYAISNYARLVSFTESIREGNIIKATDNNGTQVFRYKYRKNGILLNKSLPIGPLVAKYFLAKPTVTQLYVLHTDYNALNNHVSNLAWATAEEKTNHYKANPNVLAARVKFVAQKLKSDGRKLTITRVMLLKKMLLDPNRKTRMKIIAKQFGVSEMQLYRIKSGENWGHIKV